MDAEFKIINLLPLRPGRPLKFEKIALEPLYQNARPITYEKYKDMKQLLPYIPPLSTIEEDSCDFNEETNDSATFEQFMNIQQEEEEEKEIEEDMTVEVDFQDYESD
ncbi:hypothetical protein K1T71_009280 [Dendrolimus kikuchii]|uniref:Uncharacterized protein n=1 Tax=Dendrolimus kikuchii TaxID=765133 RepID=A0ACC1CTX5_9NEOP|nr:hypothetical protein K1T71_009280 [Dendrolimus kikuchii]